MLTVRQVPHPGLQTITLSMLRPDDIFVLQLHVALNLGHLKWYNSMYLLPSLCTSQAVICSPAPWGRAFDNKVPLKMLAITSTSYEGRKIATRVNSRAYV
jgi:hypothetical protein